MNVTLAKVVSVLVGMAMVLPMRGALAWDVRLADGTLVPIESVPFLRKWPGMLADLQRKPVGSQITLASSKPTCPFVYWLAEARNEAVEKCNGTVQSRLESFPASTKEECRCDIALEGRVGQNVAWLLPDTERAQNSYLGAVAKLVERSQGNQTEGRGIYSFSNEDRAFRLYNQNLKLMCKGNYGQSMERIQFDCSGIGTSGQGRIKMFTAPELFGGIYYLAHVDLSNGATLDFAVNIVDEELRKRHPSFPVWQ